MAPFEALDFVYMPSRDVAAEVERFEAVLGAEVVFAIEAFETRVAMVRLADGPPDVLLAGHLEGERPILVYRVADLDATVAALEEAGAEVGHRFGIPFGPGCTVTAPGGHRLAVYERTRPGAAEHLVGRRDF
jgi:hypothetical protein